MGPLADLQVRLAYYGGLFDGEGCVYIAIANPKTDPRTSVLYASITMTDAASLALLLQDFGGQLNKAGKVHPPKVIRQPYRWCVASEKAERFLVAIRPYSIIKAPQIDVGIMFQRHKTLVGRTGRRGQSLEEQRWRLEMAQRLRDLKKLFVHGAASGIAAKSGNGANPNPEPSKPDLFPGWACVETMGRRQSLYSESQEIVQSDRN